VPDFTVTVSVNDAKIIKHLADRTGVTGRELVESQISNWTSGQIKGFFIDKIRDKTTAELIALLGDIVEDDD
jgi:hypothetical protein